MARERLRLTQNENGTWKAMLGDTDISHCVRRIELDVSGAPVALATLHIAVEAEFDGLVETTPLDEPSRSYRLATEEPAEPPREERA